MLIELTGVLDDGTRPLSDLVPADPRAAITLQAGTTTIVRVKLISRANTPVQLGADEHLVLSARAQSPQGKRLFTKTSIASAGRAAHFLEFTIASEDTRALQVTRAVYDIFAKRASGRYAVVPTSQLVIARSTADVANLP